MSHVSIFDRSWIDLVFENRNQLYGAYQLRKQSPQFTLLALFFGILIFGGIIGGILFYNYVSPKVTIPVNEYENKVLRLSDLKELNEIHAATLLEKPKQSTANSSITTTQIVPSFPKYVPSNISDAQIELPIIDTQNTNTTENCSGDFGTGNNQNGLSLGNSTEFTNSGNEVNNKSTVDKLPEFPGGMHKFYEKFTYNFDTGNINSVHNLSIIVSFIIEKDGSLSNIKLLRTSGNEADEEAIRALSQMKVKWNPGLKKGIPVRTELQLPIKVQFKSN